jgi:L-glutamine:scyllo-inosose aminotransferase/L-glutamine:2-deoxy-scyllo-inosose/3-amino-2,3-dideoxy-scyllo-inosose aminotransferase
VVETLAVSGGSPVVSADWPSWPAPGPHAGDLLAATLASERWTLSGPWTGRPSNEQEFAARFAAFNEVGHCVPTASGTTALTIALEALGVGAGDEVIVPGLTWVASASSVLNVNAVPVLVDVDPSTLCGDPDAIEAAITPRTAAIMVVHLYCSLADLDRIMAIADRHGLPVLEDCAQAHGARWRGRRVGTVGRVGAFSMQQTKLLTGGEGGAAITGDAGLAERLFQLRADGRRLAGGPLARLEMELIEQPGVMGNNYCLSEFGAAMLLDQVADLDRQNAERARAAARLTDLLGAVPGVTPVPRLPAVSSPTYYQYAVRCEADGFADRPAWAVAAALAAELGYPVRRCYPPLNGNPLYQPHTKRRYHLSAEHLRRVDPTGYHLPVAQNAHQTVLLLHHPFLLAGEGRMAAVAEAFAKVQRLADRIPLAADSAEPPATTPVPA